MKKMLASISKNTGLNDMHKKIFIVVAVQFLLLLMPLTAEAKTVSAVLPAHTVTIDGQALDSTYRQYPLLVYKDITYLPLTSAIQNQCGLAQAFYDEPYIAGGKPVWFVGLADKADTAWTLDKRQKANPLKHNVQILDGMIALNTVFPKNFYDNQEASYPLLSYRDMVYLPLTYDIVTDVLGWAYAYDGQNGLVIDTTEPIRPQFQSDIIPRRSPQAWGNYQQYAYYPDGYLGYPNRTFGSYGTWQLEYKQKGHPVQVVDIVESLEAAMEGDIEFNVQFDADGQQIPAPQEPWLSDGKAYIFCVDIYSNKNLLMSVDMQTAEVTLTPYMNAEK